MSPARRALGVIAATVAAGCLSVLLAALLMTDHTWGGPVVLDLTVTHGVHLLDLPLVAAWVVGVGCCAYLGARRG